MCRLLEALVELLLRGSEFGARSLELLFAGSQLDVGGRKLFSELRDVVLPRCDLRLEIAHLELNRVASHCDELVGRGHDARVG